MIKQSSIDGLRFKAELLEVLSWYTTVKNNVACCPIHSEKTPSFHIYKAKQTFKCFGCGASGDVFKFIMIIEKLSFPEAIEFMANKYNYILEYEDEQKQKNYQVTKDKRNEMLKLIEWAHNEYKKAYVNLPATSSSKLYLQQRGYNEERVKAWDFGFAPNERKFLTNTIINSGQHTIALEVGLIGNKESNSWDFYRNRIIIPIHDHNGFIIGFAARWVPTSDSEQDKKEAKYLNPCESLIYSKRKVFYGLWQSQKAIKDKGFVYLVEGYFDVHAMQDNGMENTIAACGTEVSEEQIKLLKRYTEEVVLCFDNDAAGVKKQLKLIDLFLSHDFKVKVAELPPGQDPDEFINNLLLTK